MEIAVYGQDIMEHGERVHVRFTRSEQAWKIWLNDDGWHVWTPAAKQRRDTKRFIRDEVARRRLQGFRRENADRPSASSAP